MPGSQNTSFIPKHNSTKTERKSTPRQLFIGTILVRILFFAVLIASVGAFAYDRRVSGQLATEVAAFRAATQSFEADEQKLQTVLSLDRRLVQANERILKSASVHTVLTALEATTVQSAQIKTLTITREDDATIVAEASVTTDSFDSVLFQRSILEANEVLQGVEIEEVAIVSNTEEATTVGEVEAITFRALFAIEQEAIPVVPRQVQPQVSPVTPASTFVPVAAPATAPEVAPAPAPAPAPVSNQDDI